MKQLTSNAFLLYTVIFLYKQNELLLLQRSPEKKFAPNRWTGIGGKVETSEYDDLGASALRELKEETGLTRVDLNAFKLRRALYHNRLGEPLTGLLYYTAEYHGEIPSCSEGDLHWKTPEDFANLDIIETTAHVLPCLVRDIKRDPHGLKPVKIGLAHYEADKTLTKLSWSDTPAPAYND